MVSFIPPSFTITSVLLSSTSFRLSTTSVSFRPSVFQHTIAHPLPIIFACLSACFGFGFVILFAKKKQQKDTPNPCVNGAAPRTSCFRVTPSASARAFFRFQLHRLHSGTLRLRWTSLPPRLTCLFWLTAVFTYDRRKKEEALFFLLLLSPFRAGGLWTLRKTFVVFVVKYSP